uniref:Thylakoid preprotein translocase n=1 Tax=Lotharella vacuolata TaxID=74820 RepID=A0A0H5BQS5_9EUKA|nr:thylakoid preprotein translocase [Lotharella vacuolata]
MHKLLSIKKLPKLSFNIYSCNFNNSFVINQHNIEKNNFKNSYLEFKKKSMILKNSKTPLINRYYPIISKITIIIFYFFLIKFFSNFQVFIIDTFVIYNNKRDNMHALYNNSIQDGFFKIDILSLGLFVCINSKIILQLFLAQIKFLQNDIKENGLKGKIKLENLNKLMTILISYISSFFYFSFIWQFFDVINEFVHIIFILNILFGSLFILWISEQINDVEIGQGLSIIILYNLMMNLENKLSEIKLLNSNFSAVGYSLLYFLLVTFAFGLVLIQDSEKKLQIKYLQIKTQDMNVTKISHKKKNKFISIPIKANSSNVFSFILTFFLLQENFNTPLFHFLNQYSIYDKNLILIIKNTAVFSILVMFNTVFGIQQINLTDIVKNIQDQNISVLKINSTKNLKKYIVNYILSASMLSSLMLIILFNLLIFFENSSNLKIIRGITSNTVIIISGITIDVVKRLYVAVSFTCYDKIKL